MELGKLYNQINENQTENKSSGRRTVGITNNIKNTRSDANVSSIGETHDNFTQKLRESVHTSVSPFKTSDSAYNRATLKRDFYRVCDTIINMAKKTNPKVILLDRGKMLNYIVKNNTPIEKWADTVTEICNKMDNSFINERKAKYFYSENKI